MEIRKTPNTNIIPVLMKKNTNKTTQKKTLDKQRDILWNLKR